MNIPKPPSQRKSNVMVTLDQETLRILEHYKGEFGRSHLVRFLIRKFDAEKRGITTNDDEMITHLRDKVVKMSKLLTETVRINEKLRRKNKELVAKQRAEKLVT